MTKVAERSRAVYAATLYHDSVDDASDRQRDLGYHPSLNEAVRAVNEVREPADGADEGWFTGGVIYGHLFPAVFGIRPERFESDDREVPWFVGIDGKADR